MCPRTSEGSSRSPRPSTCSPKRSAHERLAGPGGPET
jgi:hypothetical protein